MKPLSTKSRLKAFLLCWFLGALGVHRFYTGHKKTGTIMLVLSLTFVGIAITGIWAIVDMVKILIGTFEDGEGNVLLSWSSSK